MLSSKELKKAIGSNIRREREKRGISIDELAAMLNLSSAFIGLIERGQRGAKLMNLMIIAEIFELSLDELVLSESNPNKIEIVPDSLEAKKATIKSLMFSLSAERLDFIIIIMKNLMELKLDKID